MIFTLTSIQAIEWTIRILSIYLLIDSAEKLYSFREFRSNGFWGWQTLRNNRFFASRPLYIKRLLDYIFNFSGWIFLLSLRAFSGLWLLYRPQQNLLTLICLAIVFVSCSLMNFRNAPFGAETENRFTVMLSGALLLRGIVPTELVTEVCLWFIALQSCISYITAGITKWINKEWRMGNGLLYVVGSPSLVSIERLRIFFKENQSLAKLLAWITIGIECIFPLVLIIGKPYFWLFLIWGVVFHLTIAIVFRLGKFFWVWIATYPAIIFIAQ